MQGRQLLCIMFIYINVMQFKRPLWSVFKTNPIFLCRFCGQWTSIFVRAWSAKVNQMKSRYTSLTFCFLSCWQKYVISSSLSTNLWKHKGGDYTTFSKILHVSIYVRAQSLCASSEFPLLFPSFSFSLFGTPFVWVAPNLQIWVKHSTWCLRGYWWANWFSWTKEQVSPLWMNLHQWETGSGHNHHSPLPFPLTTSWSDSSFLTLERKMPCWEPYCGRPQVPRPLGKSLAMT